MSLLLSGCFWQRAPGPVPVDLAEGPVARIGHRIDGPLAWVNLTVRAGSAHDPIGREGLAWLTARMLREGGAGGRSAEEVEAELYALGADIDVLVDREQVTFRTKCLVEDLDEMADLLGDMLLEPALEGATLSRLLDSATDWLTRGVTDSDERLGLSVFDDWMFTGHPYGHPVQGRAGVVGLLDRGDIEGFLAERYVRPAMVLGMAGPMVEGQEIRSHAPGAAAAALLAARLSTETPTDLYRDVTPRPVPSVSGRSLLVVEKSTDATGLHLGHDTELTPEHADWPAMVLAMTAFGEHRQSHGRLYQTLRGTRGLNYGDYAYVGIYRQAGWSSEREPASDRLANPFYVWIRPTDAVNGPFALRAAVKMIEELAAEGLTEDEFATMQQYLSGRISLWAADPGRRLGFAVSAVTMGWADPLQTLPAQIEALTLEAVNDALRRHVRPDDLRIVAVTGDAEALVSAVIQGENEEKPTDGEGSAASIVYTTAAPEVGSPQHTRDLEFSRYSLELKQTSVLTTEELFR
ncbi:MAG: pitrilysin family protein [Myxococcota bacterium]|nr:pitrilysin family protein [Myxococcota bacterium]